ncbi:MAG: hypothetical protein BWY06_03204 [Candidatus Latescibacteria bacterium ADurb.Bin168]|nr:MAG: hypothetical protein BWY06_03204 [Candidatus Latescibacteria bacterium ADurb.Bin168]
MFTVHAAVFPFNRKRPLVANVVQSTNDLFEVHRAASHAPEIPGPPVISEIEMRAEDTPFAIKFDDRILHVHVENPVAKRVDELRRAHALPVQVARVKVEPERRVILHRFESRLGGVDVVRDLCRVNFKAELDSVVGEAVQYRFPFAREISIPCLNHPRSPRREAVKRMPDSRAGETVDNRHPQVLRRNPRQLHFVDRPVANLLRPIGQFRRRKAVCALVVRIADELAGKVIGNRPDFQPMFRQQLLFFVAVLHACGGFFHVEVITPARKLKTVVSEPLRLRRKIRQLEIGPLSCKQCYWSWHPSALPGYGTHGTETDVITP